MQPREAKRPNCPCVSPYPRSSRLSNGFGGITTSTSLLWHFGFGSVRSLLVLGRRNQRAPQLVDLPPVTPHQAAAGLDLDRAAAVGVLDDGWQLAWGVIPAAINCFRPIAVAARSFDKAHGIAFAWLSKKRAPSIIESKARSFSSNFDHHERGCHAGRRRSNRSSQSPPLSSLRGCSPGPSIKRGIYHLDRADEAVALLDNKKPQPEGGGAKVSASLCPQGALIFGRCFRSRVFLIVNPAMISIASKETAKVIQSRRLAARMPTKAARAMPISSAVLMVTAVGCAYRPCLFNRAQTMQVFLLLPFSFLLP